MIIEKAMPVEAITTQLLALHKTNLTVSFLFAGCRIDLRTNSRTLIDELSHYYHPFLYSGEERPQPDVVVHAIQADPPEIRPELTVKQPDPGKDKVKEEYLNIADGRIVRKRITGMVFIFGRDAHLAVGPCVENSNQIINFINNRHIQWKLNRGGLLGHASAVVEGDRAIAIAGFSGAGKSTLALHMMSNGIQYLSNDRVMISPVSDTGDGKQNEGLEITGVAKLPRINPGTILANPDLVRILTEEEKKHFARLPSDELWKLEHKYDVYIEEIYGPERFILTAPMVGLVILNWQRDAGPIKARLVNLRSRQELLPAFQKDVGLFFFLDEDRSAPDFSQEHYLELLEKVDVLELSGGIDFDRGAELAMKLLRGETEELAKNLSDGQ